MLSQNIKTPIVKDRIFQKFGDAGHLDGLQQGGEGNEYRWFHAKWERMGDSTLAMGIRNMLWEWHQHYCNSFSFSPQ